MKPEKIWKRMVTIFILTIAFNITLTTHAASIEIEQKNGSPSLRWTVIDNGAWYGLQIASDKDFTDIVHSEATTKALSDYKVPDGKTYYAKVGYGTTEDDCFQNFSDVIEIVGIPTEEMSDIKFTGADDKTAHITWNNVPGANGYEIRYYYSKNKYNSWDTTKTTFKVPINDGIDNTIYVYPYRKAATGYKAYNTEKFINNVTKLTTKISKSKIYYWGMNSFNVKANGTGLDVEGQTISGKKYTFKGKNDNPQYYNEFRFSKKIKIGKMYKYRMRAYITTTDGKKITGKWSSYKYLISPKGFQAAVKGNTIKLKWKKMTGVSKIKIQVSTRNNKGYKTCATLKGNKTSYTIKKYGKKKLTKGRTYYYRVLYYVKKGVHADGDTYGWNFLFK